MKECLDNTPFIDTVDADSWTPIPGATNRRSTCSEGWTDVGRCLRATAMYIDNVGSAQDEDKAEGVLEVPVGRSTDPSALLRNRTAGSSMPRPYSPTRTSTPRATSPTVRSGRCRRTVEKERSIGAPVSAHDEDDDLLIYTLSGPDAESFRIGRNDGQLKTEGPLNYEARSSYSVVVTATDPFGAMDSIQVTINVTDEDDPAVITVESE